MSLYGIFLALLTLSASGSLNLARFAWRRRAVPGARAYALTLLGASIWAAGYLCELITPGLGGKIFWDNLQFLGVDALATGGLLFILTYSGGAAWHAASAGCSGWCRRSTSSWSGATRSIASYVAQFVNNRTYAVGRLGVAQPPPDPLIGRSRPHSWP